MRIGILIMLTVLFSAQTAFAESSGCYNMRERIKGAIAQCQADLVSYPYLGAHPVVVMDTATQGRINCNYSSGSFREGQAFFTDCGPAIVPPPTKPDTNPNSCTAKGSIIQTASQVLGETIPLTGSSFNLVYYSNKVTGRTADYIFRIPLTGTDLPDAVSGYSVEIKNELGTIIDNATYVKAPSLTHVYQWNGVDAGSNETWGLVKRTVTVNEDASDYVLPAMPREIFIGSLKAKKLGTGAWLPSVWHFYDSASGTLFKGDGRFRKVPATLVSGQYRLADETGKEVYYFDSTGKIVETRTGLTGQVIYSFAYDSAGRISTITEPFGRVTTFSRYLSGALKAIVTPNGTKTSITINSNGYLATATNPNSEVYTMAYNGAGGLLTSFTIPSGDVTTLTYDTEGNLLTDVNSSGKSSTLAKNSSGAVSLTSAMGRISGNGYDYYSKKEVATNASGFPYQQTTRDDQDVIVSPGVSRIANYGISDPRFGTQVHLPSSESNTDFGTRNTQYDKSVTLNNPADPFSINTLTEITRTLPSEVTSVYTGATKTRVTTSKLGVTHTVQIDDLERPVMEKIGTMVDKNYTYTNNLLTLFTQGTRKRVMSYYSNNLLKSVRDTLGQVTSYTYDAAQRLATKTLPDSRVINYSYDTNGNLASITPPGKPVHQLDYEIDGQLSTYSPPVLSGVSSVNTEYTYNNDRQLTKITRPDGEEINYNYNATTGLQTSITGNFDTITKSYTQGRLDTITQSGHTSLIGYDGSMMSFLYNTDLNGAAISRVDRVASTTFGGKVGQEKVSALGPNFVQKIINYTYDNDENLSKVGDLELHYNVPNGQLEGTVLGHIKDYYYYDNFGAIRAYKAKHGATVLYEYNLSRDSIGRVIQKIETLNNVTSTFDYVYDAAGRLIQVSTNGVVSSTYTYDSNSNRIGGSIRGEATSATYDDQDRLTNYNGDALTYNANGELLTKGSATLTYDVFGNLREFVKGAQSTSYEIDPLQRRLGRSVNGNLTTRYIYNADNQVVGQMDEANKLVKTFVYGTKSHVPDYYIDQNNRKFRIITDYLGSVRLVVSNSGRVLQMMEHDEFGRKLQDTRPGFLPFGFAGGLYEHRTGLVRFVARDYDPETGRWVSKDPIRFDGKDTNQYGYVLQDSVNSIDPKGLQAAPVIVAAAAICVAIISYDFVDGQVRRTVMQQCPDKPDPVSCIDNANQNNLFGNLGTLIGIGN